MRNNLYWVILLSISAFFIVSFDSFSQYEAPDSVYVKPNGSETKASNGITFAEREQGIAELIKFKLKGPFALAHFGPSINIKSSRKDMSLNVVGGYQINEYFSTGLGIGFYEYTYNIINYLEVDVYPIFIDTRFYIPGKRINPMFTLDVGYSFMGESKYVQSQNQNTVFIPNPSKGGLFASVGAGARVHVTEVVSFVFDGGLAIQTFKGENFKSVYDPAERVYKETSVEAKDKITSLRLNLGVAFNISPNSGNK